MEKIQIKVLSSMLKFLVCFLFSVFCFLLVAPIKGFADSDEVFIDPSDPTMIRRTAIPFESQILLKASDLPQESSLHKMVNFGEQTFTYIALNPDKSTLAFSVNGSQHDWSGIYTLADKSIRQLTLRFESKALEPYWSNDGRFVAFEEEEPNKMHFFDIFDLDGDTSCSLNGKVANNKYLNFFHPWWSKNGGKIFFKVEINNVYRKSLGLKPLKIPSRIGEATGKCQNVVLRTVAKFMAEVPTDPLPENAMAAFPQEGF